MGNVVTMKNVSGAATSSSTQHWGPGQVVDPALSSESTTQNATNSSCNPDNGTSHDKMDHWQWKEHHTLRKWGGQRCMDMAATGLPDELIFKTLVTPELKCRRCGKQKNVLMLRHHPGGCGAYEWVYGIDVDWRWTCCGKHEDFSHLRKCDPNGSHSSGCVEAPVCVVCFSCPCGTMIEKRRKQDEEC